VESTPSYVSAVKAGGFPRALRNLHISVLLTEPALALLIVATMPMSSIIGTPNILASLGALSGGWLKYIVIVDAVIVLAGGIISGTVGCMGTAQALVNDKILANFFQRALPRTGARWPQIVLFLALCLIMCGTSNFNLTIMSSVCECSSPSCQSLQLTSTFSQHRLPVGHVVLPAVAPHTGESCRLCASTCVALTPRSFTPDPRCLARRALRCWSCCSPSASA
jgi:amino acid transporter